MSLPPGVDGNCGKWYGIEKAGGEMKIHTLSRCGIFAAVLTLCAWLSVPLGDQAVSLQTFGVFMALGLLGGKQAAASVAVYLLLGAVGVPVFTGFRGGFSVLLGPAGGYLWGFLAACLLWWALEKRLPDWLKAILSMVLCYGCGTAWYYFAYANGAVWPAVMVCVVPYLLPDGVKIALALLLSRRLKKLIYEKK
jgi:biotin transport system substrate-specific component